MEVMFLLFVTHVALQHATGAFQPLAQSHSWMNTHSSVLGVPDEAPYSMCVSGMFANPADQEFQGLYKPDGSPAFSNGMAVSAHNPANAWKQRVRTPSLVIVEFVLDQLPHFGTAGQLLHLSLAQNYIVTPSKLHHELIFFHIGGQDQLSQHNTHTVKVVEELQKGYVDLILLFFIG